MGKLETGIIRNDVMLTEGDEVTIRDKIYIIKFNHNFDSDWRELGFYLEGKKELNKISSVYLLECIPNKQ
jgi:hypothetical protein